MPPLIALTVMLPVPDITEAIAFYTSIGFGLQDTDEFHYGEDNVNWALMQNHGTALMLQGGGDTRPKNDLQLYLRMEDIDAYYDEISDKVVITAGLTEQFYGMRDFWFRDPFGFHWGAGQAIGDVS